MFPNCTCSTLARILCLLEIIGRSKYFFFIWLGSFMGIKSLLKFSSLPTGGFVTQLVVLGRAQLIFKAWTFPGLFFPKISFIAAHVQVIFLYLHFMCMSKCYLLHSKAINWKYVINIEVECIISLDSCNPAHSIWVISMPNISK